MIATLGYIAQKGIPGRINMVGNGITADGYIFHPTGGTGGFGKINGLAGP
jgi:hypothetical protein